MSLTQINQNISSLDAQRSLNLNSQRISSAIEKLSSGLRINSGADDPSGLVLSELMRAQVAGLNQAQTNAQQGDNVVKTAEGALNEVNSLLSQMRDLAVSAASDSNNTDQSRAALQSQVASALKTIDDIASRTVYGKRNLLDGSAGTKTTVIDSSDVASADLNLAPSGQTAAAAGTYAVNVTQAAAKAEVDSAALGTAVAADTISSAASGITGFDAGDEVALYVNGTKVNIGTNGQNTNIGSTTTFQNIVDSINANSSTLGVTASFDDTTHTMSVQSTKYGSDQHVSLEYVKVTDPGADMDLTNILSGAGEDLTATAAGVDAQGTVDFGGAAGVQNFNSGKGLNLVSDNGYGSVTLSEAGATTVANHAGALSATKGSLSFQIGIDANQTAEISVADCHALALGTGTTGTANLSLIDVSTVAGANDALATIDAAIGQISTLRGDLGAFQTNELESQSRSLSVSSQNLAASESAIRDTDFGSEMSEFTTAQVLVQSATAFLAQANNLTQNVMTLIKG